MATTLLAIGIATLALLLGGPTSATARLRADARGGALFATDCAPCHGASGRGDGPEGIYFAPPPRDLHEGFLDLYATDELVARIRNGQPLTIDIDRAALRRRSHMIDDIIAHVQRLPDVRWTEAERGATLYDERCESCHGPFGRHGGVMPGSATQKKPPDLSDRTLQRELGDAQLLELAQHHRKGLPSLPPLTDEGDRKALLAYLRLLSPGFELYSLWCGACHGDDGRGNGVLASGSDKPDVVFDRAFLAAQSPANLRHEVQHMIDAQEGGMPHLRRHLTEEQARTVIEYLRATDPSPRPSPGRP